MAKPIESDENKMSCRVTTSPGSSFAILPVPARAGLVNRNRNAGFHFLRETHDVPVGEPDTTMTDGATDRLWLASSVQANAFFVKRNPDHTHWAVRTRRQHMEITAALAVFEHLFIVTKPWQLRDPAHFPFTYRRRSLRGTVRERVSCDQLVGLENSEHVCFHVII